MVDQALEDFADVLIAFTPSIPMNKEEIIRYINSFGIDSFIKNSGSSSVIMFAEISDLLSYLDVSPAVICQAVNMTKKYNNLAIFNAILHKNTTLI